MAGDPLHVRGGDLHDPLGVAALRIALPIPLGLADFKLIPVSSPRLGREIVSVDQARAMAWARTLGSGSR